MFKLFNKKTGPTMASITEDMKQQPQPLLLDVRTKGEYDSGHLPSSINLPLDRLDEIKVLAPDKDALVYLYCRSGSRSGFAASNLKRMGYAQAYNVGGILSYRGTVER